VNGKLRLLGLPFLAPVWVGVSFTKALYDKGELAAHKISMAAGGKFAVQFGEGLSLNAYNMVVSVYGGPTIPAGQIPVPPAPPGGEWPALPELTTIPPFPPVATFEKLIIVVPNTFVDLQAEYEQGATRPISMNSPGKVHATLTFKHGGGAMDVDVGFGLKYPPKPTWAFKTISVTDDIELKQYSVEVEGDYVTNLEDCRRIDTLKFIQVKGGPRDIGGGGFIIADWDREVYHQSVKPLKRNGDTFRAKLTFNHKGAGGDFDVGIGVRYTPEPTWAYNTVTLPDDPTAKSYTVEVEGIWSTDLPTGRLVDVLKFIQVKDGPRDIGGQGFIIADPDRDVFRVG
jgi:hypothetical protein